LYSMRLLRRSLPGACPSRDLRFPWAPGGYSPTGKTPDQGKIRLVRDPFRNDNIFQSLSMSIVPPICKREDFPRAHKSKSPFISLFQRKIL
jgi:hypothetical protein